MNEYFSLYKGVNLTLNDLDFVVKNIYLLGGKSPFHEVHNVRLGNSKFAKESYYLGP